MKGYMYIFTAAALWGLIGPFAKLAFREGLAPLEVAFWRAALAGLCFGTQAVWQRQTRVVAADLPALGVFGLTGVFLFYGSYQLAVQRGGAALASVLLYTAPAWVALMAVFFFREKMNGIKWMALVATLAGVALVSIGSGGVRGSTAGQLAGAVFFGLVAGFCYSLYYIFGKYFGGKYSAATVFLYILPLGAVCLLPWVSFAPKSGLAWLALASIAVLCTYGAYHCHYAALRYLEAGRAAIAATLEPVVAAVVAFFWWGEFFSPAGYIGSGLIITAVILTVRDRSGIGAPENGSDE
ncbi:MAG: EamA family transporter [Desulfobacterales bacterium]